MQRVWVFGILSPKSGIFHQTLPFTVQGTMQRRKQQDFKSQRWWMTSRKHYYPATTGLIWSQKLWPHTQNLYRFKTDRVPALRRGRGSRHRVPTVTKKLSITDPIGKEKNLLSPMESHWVYQPQFSQGPSPGVAGQHKPNPMIFCGFHVYFVLLYFC